MLQKLTSIWHFGFVQEVSYNLNRLSKQVSRVWDQLIEKIKNDPKLHYSDLFKIKVYDRVSYNPTRADYSNKFSLDYSNINFYKGEAGRLFEALGIIELTSLGISLITEIKSTMYEDIIKASEGHDLVSDLSNDGISASIISLTTQIGSLSSLDLMTNSPTVDINLATSIVSGDLSNTLSNVIKILKSFYSKDIFSLGYKLEDHELFLVKVVELINILSSAFRISTSSLGFNCSFENSFSIS